MKDAFYLLFINDKVNTTTGKIKTFSDDDCWQTARCWNYKYVNIIKLLSSLQNENASDQTELSESINKHMNHEDSNGLFHKVSHQRLLDKTAR